MKASLKLREGQKPLVRAKIPLNILGLPLVSGIYAGDNKELCLHLGTFWDTGPTLKFAYKPNDSWNPFSVILKTGTGEWGSPAGASMTMSAELNLLGRGNPSFCLQFKPHFGDFTLNQSARSSLVLPSKHGEDGGLVGPIVHKPSLSQETTPSKFSLKFNGFENKEEEGSSFEKTPDLENGTTTPNPLENGGFAVSFPEEGLHKYQFSDGIGNLKDFWSFRVEKLLGGVSLTARSSLPVRKHAIVRVRWGVKLPTDLFKGVEAGDQSGFTLSKLPCLFLDKVSIENVEQRRYVKSSGYYGSVQAPLEDLMLPIIREEANELAHITGICCSMKRQLHLLQTENRVLKKTVEDMRSELQYTGVGNSTDNLSSLDASSWQSPHAESSRKEKSREWNYQEGDKKKGGSREGPKKDQRSDSKAPNAGLGKDFPISSGNPAVDVSEELKKAIRGASGSLGDK